MGQRIKAKLERLYIPDGEGGRITARFFVRPGSVRRKWKWFDPWQVPDFDEEEAWFELEQVKGGWKVLHKVADQP